MKKAVYAVAVCSFVLFCSSSHGQGKKDYMELDRDAMQLFQDEKYDEARKVWAIIRNDYSRTGYKVLPITDPRFGVWQNTYHEAIVREGIAQKQVLLESPDPKKKAMAEAAYTSAVANAREVMRRFGVPQAVQDTRIKNAASPLLNLQKNR